MQKATIESYLEGLSESLLNAWDGSSGAESYDFLRKHSSADFRNKGKASADYLFPEAKNLEEHISVLKELKRANPGWRVNVFNFSAVVDREHGLAVVWFTSGASGNPGGAGDWTTNRESVSKLLWRKRKTDCEWECYSHHAIRGGGVWD